MLNRERFLRVHGVTTEQWAERYGIEPFSHPCRGCGALLTTTIPFAIEQLRGLTAPECPCGNDRPPFCVVRDPKHGDLFDGPLTAPQRRIPKAKRGGDDARKSHRPSLPPSHKGR